MQGLGYLCKLGDELVVITHKCKETSDLCDHGGGRPFSNNVCFSFISCYCLGRDNVPKNLICLQNSSHLEVLSFIQPVPISARQPSASEDGWLDLLKKLLYHL